MSPPADDLQTDIERHLLAQELAGLGSWTMELPDARLSWSPQMFRILGLDPAKDTPSIETYEALIPKEDLAHIQAINEAERGFPESDGQPTQAINIYT